VELFYISCGCKSDVVFFFLGAFSKLRKTTISFVKSLLPFPSVPTEQLDSDWKDFYEILYLSIFEKLSKIFKFH